jgi:hypothetical protein
MTQRRKKHIELTGQDYDALLGVGVLYDGFGIGQSAAPGSIRRPWCPLGALAFAEVGKPDRMYNSSGRENRPKSVQRAEAAGLTFGYADDILRHVAGVGRVDAVTALDLLGVTRGPDDDAINA